MLVGELCEMMLKNLYCIFNLRSLAAALDLEKEAFLKITCTNSGRLELLNHLEHLQNFLLCGLDVCPEREVIHQAVYASSEIAVIIKASDYE